VSDNPLVVTSKQGPTGTFRTGVEWVDTDASGIYPAHLGTSSMTREFEVWGEPYDDQPRALVARGRYVTVHIGADEAMRRSTRWPAEWVDALGAQCRM
jgi:hypothetical protein